METQQAVTTLNALAHPARLDVFRLLVTAGPAGLPAGEIASRCGLAPNTLSFHLKELSHANLVSRSRHGRSISYAIRPPLVRDLLAFLTEDCCQGRPELCLPNPDTAASCCQEP